MMRRCLVKRFMCWSTKRYRPSRCCSRSVCPRTRSAMREISPSLEDVFVTLTANAEAKAKNATPDPTRDQ